jgi:cytochrome c2
MKKISALLLLISAMPFVEAANIDAGRTLHEAKCTGCHDSSIYTRPNNIVHSFSSLENRVKFCDVATQAGLNEAQIDDIIAYLNDSFYKFEKK